MSGREQRIRERAYAIWEGEGRPHSRHDEHWAMAQKEIGDEELAPPHTRTQAASDATAPDATPSPAKARRSSATGAPGPTPAAARRRPPGASWTPADIKPAGEVKPPKGRRTPAAAPK